MEYFKYTRLFAYQNKISENNVDVYINCHMLKNLQTKFRFGQVFDQISVDHNSNTLHIETADGDEIYKTSSDIFYLE